MSHCDAAPEIRPVQSAQSGVSPPRVACPRSQSGVSPVKSGVSPHSLPPTIAAPSTVDSGQASRGRESAGVRPVGPGCELPPGSIAGIPWGCGYFAASLFHAKTRRREQKRRRGAGGDRKGAGGIDAAHASTAVSCATRWRLWQLGLASPAVSECLTGLAVCAGLSAAALWSADCDGGPRHWAACGRVCGLGQEVSGCVCVCGVCRDL